MPKKYKHWTDEETQRLIDLAKNHTFNELAKIFDKPKSSIYMKCAGLGIRHGTSSSRSYVDRVRIFTFYKENGLRKTCEHYSLSRHAVGSIVAREKKRQQKISSGVIALHAEKLRSLAIGYAAACGYAKHAEDFGSFCVVKKYEGKSNKKIEFLFSDYKRETIGDPRYRFDKLRYLENTTIMAIGEGDGESTFYADPPDIVDYHSRYEAIDAMKLNGNHRICFILHAVFGLQCKEIAFCLNVDDSRVSQILAEAEAKIRELHIDSDSP